MSSMVLDARSIDSILSGSRTWQLRFEKVSHKGVIEVVQGCSDLILGTVEVVGCIGPLTEQVVEDSLDKFNLSELEAKQLSNRIAKGMRVYAMILESPRRYMSPVIATEDTILAEAV